MSFISKTIIGLVAKRAGNRFNKATLDPCAVQNRLLGEIMDRNQNTEYGRKHGFSSVKSLEDYSRQVPVVDYEDIRDDIERMTRGETNILVAENPILFAQTSGTTGSPKYIPVTPVCRKGGGMTAWLHYAKRSHPRIFDAKIITIVSPAIEGYTEGNIPFGSTSGMVVKEMPGLVQSAYAVPYDVFEIQDYNAKYYAIMRLGLQEKVTMVATANPSSILKLAEMADRFSEDLIRDVRDGSISKNIELEADIRKILETILKPNPTRAGQLEKSRQTRDGKLLPADYWPEMALLGCWKGGTVSAYIDRLTEWYNPDRKGMIPVRDMGYLASEARMSIPVTDHGAGGVLTVHLNVFEFVPAEQVEDNPDDKDSWDFLGVEKIRPGREYYVFVTTTGGLYRYDMNDVIEVVDHFNKTPVIEFRRKGRGMSNLTGEKLSVNQLMEAMSRADASVEAAIHHYRAEPDFQNSLYVFKVEAGQLDTDRRTDLLFAIDDALGELNIEYKAKRSSGRLKAPILQVMKSGWYERQKQKLVEEGKRLFQAKTILLDSKLGYTPEPEELEADVRLESKGDGR